MIFKRSEYLNKLIARKHNGLIKLVTGTRRAGEILIKWIILFASFKWWS